MRTTLKWVVTACLVGMLASCEDKGSGGPDAGGNPGGDGGGGGGNTDTVQPGVLKGQVVYSNGQPLQGVLMHAVLATTNGVPGKTTTDAQGRYQMTHIPVDVPYKVYSWVDVTYHNRRYCLRVAPDTSADYEVFFSREGAIRNFRWKLSARMEDSIFEEDDGAAWFGGSIRLFVDFPDGDYNSTIELTLTPTGPLIDGSTGSVVNKTVELQKTKFAVDIPAGGYKVTASRVKSDGTRVSARVGGSYAEAAGDYSFDFLPEETGSTTFICGSAGASSGLERKVMYIVSP